MKGLFQTEVGTQLLSAVALFCYSVSLLALVGLGHSLIALAGDVGGLQLGTIYSANGM